MPVKPLYATQTRPQPKRGQPKDAEIRHSEYNGQRSDHYHAEVLGGNTRAVDELNPTEVLPAARSYPGLAN
jgi:hypothetical protein